MTTALLTHPDCLAHVNPPGHPEQVARLARVLEALDAPDFAGLRREPAPLATDAALLRVHPPTHLARLAARVPAEGYTAVDGDTFLMPQTLAAARRAAGAVVRAVDMVMAGEVRNAFCAVRPPGHHAETGTAMGFCYFGSVVVGARHALEAHGLTRVAIVDFDVHHGNGTQDLMWDESDCLFASSHQMPLYPGSGRPEEKGAHGQVLNLPLRGGTDGAAMRAAYERVILPAVSDWKPDLLLVSAGFDAHRADPLAGLDWEADDFRWLAARLWEVSGGRVVSSLEGGYDLPALTESVRAYVEEMARLSG